MISLSNITRTIPKYTHNRNNIVVNSHAQRYALPQNRFNYGSIEKSNISYLESTSTEILDITQSKTPNFYNENLLYKYDNKNVIYIAYVGYINNEQTYKFGISSQLYEREYNAHRNNFDIFDMKLVKITDNKDIIEDLFKKELKIRNLHRIHTINTKRQTELFVTTPEYNFNKIIRLLLNVIKDNPSYEVAMLQEQIKKLKLQLKMIKSLSIYKNG